MDNNPQNANHRALCSPGQPTVDTEALLVTQTADQDTLGEITCADSPKTQKQNLNQKKVRMPMHMPNVISPKHWTMQAIPEQGNVASSLKIS